MQKSTTTVSAKRKLDSFSALSASASAFHGALQLRMTGAKQNIAIESLTHVAKSIWRDTWTPSKEHERMIQSTQRKMLRLIIQTKRKYKKIEKQDIEPKEQKGIVDITVIVALLTTATAQSLKMTWTVK